MDNGEEIQGLNEGWTFMGCKLMELGSGFMVFIMVKEIFFQNEVSVGMPFMLASWIFTAFGLRSIRMMVPDEERGVRNYAMVLMGFSPPGIPAPAVIRDLWSGCRVRELSPESRYRELALDKLFPTTPEDSEDPIQPNLLGGRKRNGGR
jgi:hypothetical protein